MYYTPPYLRPICKSIHRGLRSRARRASTIEEALWHTYNPEESENEETKEAEHLEIQTGGCQRFHLSDNEHSSEDEASAEETEPNEGASKDGRNDFENDFEKREIKISISANS